MSPVCCGWDGSLNTPRSGPAQNGIRWCAGTTFPRGTVRPEAGAGAAGGGRRRGRASVYKRAAGPGSAFLPAPACYSPCRVAVYVVPSPPQPPALRPHSPDASPKAAECATCRRRDGGGLHGGRLRGDSRRPAYRALARVSDAHHGLEVGYGSRKSGLLGCDDLVGCRPRKRPCDSDLRDSLGLITR